MTRAAFLKQAYQRAARFCAQREKAPAQVIRKLSTWDLQQEEILSIIEQLKQERFLDEDRFCRAYCHDKFAFNKWGRRKIRLGLQQLSLSEDHINEGLKTISETAYRQTIKELIQKKVKSIKEPDQFRKKQKLISYLLSKGFEPDLIRELIDDLSREGRSF